MSKTLYVSDLDGTLLGADSRISCRSREILNGAIAEGALFSVATARTPATVGPLLEGVDMRLPAVVMTGVSLWDRRTNSYSHTRYMKPEVAKELVEIYRRLEVPTFLYTLEEDLIRIYHQGPISELEKEFIEERSHTPYKKVYLDATGRSTIPERLDKVVLLYAIQPTEPAERLFAETSKIADINALCYHDMYGDSIAQLEAFPKEATKANAVRLLARNVGADRIVAFGDNINDLPMLGVADVAVAVGNAVEQVKAKADIIIGENTTDSVAKFIAEDFRSNRG